MDYVMWNPWHGCHKYSEGCKNCYMFSFDKERKVDSEKIYKTNTYNYPIARDKKGLYKIKPNSFVEVCLTSDFFLEEADEWREDAWKMIKHRKDVFFSIFTKRIERVEKCLPNDWGEGYENVGINLTCENQKRTDERLPIFIELPIKHKNIALSPMLEEISIKRYLKQGDFEWVYVAGENYKNARPCNYDWVKKIYEECKECNVNFEFFDTGSNFIKDGKKYFIPHSKGKEQAKKSGLNYKKEDK